MKDNEIEQYHISTVNKRVLEIALPLVTYKTEQLERMWRKGNPLALLVGI